MNVRQTPGWRVLLDRLHQSQDHHCSRPCCVVPLSFFLMPSRANSVRGNGEGTCLGLCDRTYVAPSAGQERRSILNLFMPINLRLPTSKTQPLLYKHGPYGLAVTTDALPKLTQSSRSYANNIDYCPSRGHLKFATHYFCKGGPTAPLYRNRCYAGSCGSPTYR